MGPQWRKTAPVLVSLIYSIFICMSHRFLLYDIFIAYVPLILSNDDVQFTHFIRVYWTEGLKVVELPFALPHVLLEQYSSSFNF